MALHICLVSKGNLGVWKTRVLINWLLISRPAISAVTATASDLQLIALAFTSIMIVSIRPTLFTISFSHVCPNWLYNLCITTQSRQLKQWVAIEESILSDFMNTCNNWSPDPETLVIWSGTQLHRICRTTCANLSNERLDGAGDMIESIKISNA